MSNKKETVYVKANGLRNELKEIRKSIDKLTNVAEHIIDIWAATQTHKHYEKNSSIDVAPNWVHIAKDHDRAKDS